MTAMHWGAYGRVRVARRQGWYSASPQSTEGALRYNQPVPHLNATRGGVAALDDCHALGRLGEGQGCEAAGPGLSQICDDPEMLGLGQDGEAAGKEAGLRNALPRAVCAHRKLVAQLLAMHAVKAHLHCHQAFADHWGLPCDALRA